MASIGNVEFNVISETRSYSNEVTQHPVEDGADITDHVQLNQIVFDIEGIVGDNQNPAFVHEQLSKMRRERQIVEYKGRSILPHCVIQNFTSNVNADSRKGFTFTLQLVQIRVAEPSTVSLLPTMLQIEVKEVGSAGRVQPQ